MKNQTKCDEIQKRVREYYDGVLNPSEIREIDEHLEDCQLCKNIFEKEENILFIKDKQKDNFSIRSLQRRFFRKMVIWVLGILALLCIIYNLLFGTILPKAMESVLSEKFHDLNYAITDLVAFTIPGASLLGGNIGNVSKFNITTNIEYEQKVAGGLLAGVIKLDTPIYKGKNKWTHFTKQIKHGTLWNNYHNEVFNKFESFGSGTKSTIAIYFEKPVTCEEMSSILQTVNCRPFNTWLAIDTGDAVEWKYSINKPYGELALHNPQWGFPMLILSRDWGEVYDVVKISKMFIAEMKQFQKYAEKYFDAPEFTKDLTNINHYIEQNGIRLKSAILEASNNDLLKLKENKKIVRIDILEVDFDY